MSGRAALAVPNRAKAVAVAAADNCRKAIKKQKENNRVKPEVIVISSDSENEKKNPGKRVASWRAPLLTAILTKCSRV